MWTFVYLIGFSQICVGDLITVVLGDGQALEMHVRVTVHSPGSLSWHTHLGPRLRRRAPQAPPGLFSVWWSKINITIKSLVQVANKPNIRKLTRYIPFRRVREIKHPILIPRKQCGSIVLPSSLEVTTADSVPSYVHFFVFPPV